MESDQSFRRIIIFRSKLSFWFVNSLLWVYLFVFYLQLACFFKSKAGETQLPSCTMSGIQFIKTSSNIKQHLTQVQDRLVLKFVIFLSPTLTRVKLKLATVALGFSGGSEGKNPPAMQETWVRFLSWEPPLEEGVATHSSILAWRIPRTEEPSGCSLWGRRGHDWATKNDSCFTSLA